ncbi:MAG: nuclear transport factor 2 family protein [Thermoleophilaceae bacterium]|nr:nuclear transport factor 2 family protein [Thermoleophilaceae bacterium]
MTESSLETVRRLFARFDRGGLETALDLIAEDFVVEVPGSMSAEPDVYEGHDGARRYFAGFDGLLEGVRFEPIDVIDQGDAVIVWLRLSGRGVASGIEVEQHAAVATWVEDGKVTRMEPHPDMDSARKALGA